MEKFRNNGMLLTFHQYTKKGNKEDCSNYRGISVTSVMSRLYGKILRDLIEEENKDEEEHSGFRTVRSCTDNIVCMKKLLKKGMQQTKKLIYCF
jgi:hypothetical protein